MGFQNYAELPNNTASKWYRDPGLRQGEATSGGYGDTLLTGRIPPNCHSLHCGLFTGIRWVVVERSSSLADLASRLCEYTLAGLCELSLIPGPTDRHSTWSDRCNLLPSQDSHHVCCRLVCRQVWSKDPIGGYLLY